eukprot:13076-Alexandrium_andersonii.AAC.1
MLRGALGCRWAGGPSHGGIGRVGLATRSRPALGRGGLAASPVQNCFRARGALGEPGVPTARLGRSLRGLLSCGFARPLALAI